MQRRALIDCSAKGPGSRVMNNRVVMTGWGSSVVLSARDGGTVQGNEVVVRGGGVDYGKEEEEEEERHGEEGEEGGGGSGASGSESRGIIITINHGGGGKAAVHKIYSRGNVTLEEVSRIVMNEEHERCLIIGGGIGLIVKSSSLESRQSIVDRLAETSRHGMRDRIGSGVSDRINSACKARLMREFSYCMKGNARGYFYEGGYKVHTCAVDANRIIERKVQLSIASNGYDGGEIPVDETAANVIAALRMEPQMELSTFVKGCLAQRLPFTVYRKQQGSSTIDIFVIEGDYLNGAPEPVPMADAVVGAMIRGFE